MSWLEWFAKHLDELIFFLIIFGPVLAGILKKVFGVKKQGGRPPVWQQVQKDEEDAWEEMQLLQRQEMAARAEAEEEEEEDFFQHPAEEEIQTRVPPPEPELAQPISAPLPSSQVLGTEPLVPSADLGGVGRASADRIAAAEGVTHLGSELSRIQEGIPDAEILGGVEGEATALAGPVTEEAVEEDELGGDLTGLQWALVLGSSLERPVALRRPEEGLPLGLL